MVKSKMRFRLILVVVVLAVALAGLGWWRFSEAREHLPIETKATSASFDEVSVGMTRSQVLATMGESSGTLVGPFRRDFVSRSKCAPSEEQIVEYYYRRMEPSFFVVWTREGVVACKESRHYYVSVD
jgi:hypothetical protein